jgi:hypothetical protein
MLHPFTLPQEVGRHMTTVKIHKDLLPDGVDVDDILMAIEIEEPTPIDQYVAQQNAAMLKIFRSLNDNEFHALWAATAVRIHTLKGAPLPGYCDPRTIQNLLTLGLVESDPESRPGFYRLSDAGKRLMDG